jgi:4-amino-4-deoxy-L-arabinose transferase-like glycosyltransferase
LKPTLATRPFRRGSQLSAGLARVRPATIAITLITLAAGALRFASLHRVQLDPFYDAAVRSMALSWHNFFFGAFDPSASTSIDKPPADLWLQVISVKLFGFGPVALKLPEALAGTAAVPLLYDALRRSFGQLAGLCAALVLALLPISVLTGRSDTMDSVMMLLTIAALWLLIRHIETDDARWLYLAAAAVGVAFNVKLFESFVALPALGLLALLGVLGSSAPLRARLLRIALAAAILIAVSLAWLLATLAAPAHDRPFAIGSSNGSAWNAAFVFNGVKRIGTAANEFSPAPTRTAAQRPRNNSELARAQVPISPPGALRLFDHDGPLSGLRLGYVLLAALILGLPALGAATMGPRRRERASDDRAPRRPEDASDDRDAQRLPRAVAASVIVWMLTGVVLFSAMTHLHPRYTEAFTPAVAAAAGVGLAWIARAGRVALAVAAASAVALMVYAHELLGSTGIWALTACAAALAIATAALALRRAGAAPLAVTALLIATLALPGATDASIISHHEADSGRTGAMRPTVVSALRSYLRANRGGARYELAVTASTQASELIARDAQPVLILTSLAGHELVSAAHLRREVASGAVRYAYVGGGCGPHESRKLAVCAPIASWIRAHATDVSRAAGLPRPLVLWRLRTR